MKKFLLATFGVVLLLGGCGDQQEPPTEPPVETPSETTETESEAVTGDFDAEAAATDYVLTGRCAACHGDQLQGASGPAITGLTKEEVLAAIQEGPGTMPKDLIKGEAAENLSAWIAAH